MAWRGVAWLPVSPPQPGTRWGEVDVDGEKRVQNLSLHPQRENRTDERRQGKHQLFSTITRVQGVVQVPDMLELWVEKVPALQRPFSLLPCYRAINLLVERPGLGEANETLLPPNNKNFVIRCRHQHRRGQHQHHR